MKRWTMGLFGKKDQKVEESSNSQESAVDENPTLSKQVLKIRTDVDSLNAQMLATSEMRKVTNDRFATLSETIGEIKSQLIEKDKSISKIEAKAEKASGLVETVKPESFMIEMKKLDAKIAALKGKIESTESIFNTVLDEMKVIRQKVSLFKGVEDIIKLNDDVRKELRDVQKVEAKITAHSDKVEGIYIEAQKKFNQFKDLDDKISSVKKTVDDLSSNVNEDKGKMQSFSSKDDVVKLKDSFTDLKKKMEFLLKKKGINLDEVNSDSDVVDYDSKIKDVSGKTEENSKKIEKMMEMLETFLSVNDK